MGVEGCVMEFRQGQTIRHDRLPKLLVSIHEDVGRIEQSRFGQVGDPRTTPYRSRARHPETMPDAVWLSPRRAHTAARVGRVAQPGRSPYQRSEGKPDP